MPVFAKPLVLVFHEMKIHQNRLAFPRQIKFIFNIEFKQKIIMKKELSAFCVIK